MHIQSHHAVNKPVSSLTQQQLDIKTFALRTNAMALNNQWLDATSTCIHTYSDQMRQTCASIPVCSEVAKRIERNMLFITKGTQKWSLRPLSTHKWAIKSCWNHITLFLCIPPKKYETNRQISLFQERLLIIFLYMFSKQALCLRQKHSSGEPTEQWLF